MSQLPPNHREDTQGYIAGLPVKRLTLPEPYLYKLLLEEQNLEDTAERRRQFKRLLVTRQMEEGMMPPQVDQKELSDFMNPEDSELKVERSQTLVTLLERHLQTKDFVQAQRLAVLELFHQEAPLKQAEMDEAYFRNAELVRADLESLAAAILDKTGKTIQPKDLGAGRLMAVNFTLTTGESIIGKTYLSRAAIALGKAKNKREAEKMLKESLNFLKQTAGFEVVQYPPTDEAYFRDSSKVRSDLDSLAAVVSEKAGKDIQSKDLNTSHMEFTFTITTGEYMVGATYLRRAVRALGRAKNYEEAKKMNKESLALLKQTAGFEVVEYPLLDAAYFKDSTIVRADLEALVFAISVKTGRTMQLKELKTSKIQVPFTLITGESINGQTYIHRAAIALGQAKNRRETGKMLKKTLNLLKQTAGFEVIEYPILDEAYFNEPDKVRTDLEALASAISVRTGKLIQPKDINMTHSQTYFTATTGESISGQTYLSRAAIALSKAKKDKAAKKIIRKILILLKQIAGFGVEVVEFTEPKKYPLLDTAYFKDSTTVRADLEALAAAISVRTGKVIQSKDLNLSHAETSFTLTTGESMIGETYLGRAAKALGFAKNVKEAQKMLKEILSCLKQTAGFEVIEYPILDEAYFNEPDKVRTDLEALASAISVRTGKVMQPKDINMTHIQTSFTLTTGQHTTGRTYLSRAATALGNAKNSEEARKNTKRNPHHPKTNRRFYYRITYNVTINSKSQ